MVVGRGDLLLNDSKGLRDMEVTQFQGSYRLTTISWPLRRAAYDPLPYVGGRIGAVRSSSQLQGQRSLFEVRILRRVEDARASPPLPQAHQRSPNREPSSVRASAAASGSTSAHAARSRSISEPSSSS